MKLRELLERAGELARLLPYTDITVIPQDMDNDSMFVIQWIGDDDESGPLY